ncbi:SDR family oxidoreductase [Mucilaginibacter sp.]|jgi:short-subunit dehydrogenase involved in D-alanine esterification of teichoic acids|uniref:SDR family oxidoreductase n=1 Tax=Mucilaginibacter sp. TaxID=1882438 RepID=UPI003561C3A5
MELKGKKVLITGGSAGIGFEAAKQFVAAGASVIICGRSKAKLENAKLSLPGVTAIACDVSDPDQVLKLYQQVQELGGIDILYNNAGVATLPLSLAKSNNQHFIDASYEMNINYLSVIRINNLFLDMLKEKKEAAIINTTSVLSYLPAILAPTYSATKAALRFYTEALRKHLEIAGTNVKVFELLPPLVGTDMTASLNEKKMSVSDVIIALVEAIGKDQYTVRVGATKVLYILNRFFPNKAFNLLNKERNFELFR